MLPHPERVTGLRPFVGIFPDLAAVGGIQKSGSLAWDSALLGFGPEARCIQWTADPDRRLANAFQKVAVTAHVLRAGFPDLCLVWHVSLLRLVPFFRRQPRRLFLFLHGIEAWKPFTNLERRLVARRATLLANSMYTLEQFHRINPGLGSNRAVVVPLGVGIPFVGTTPPPALAPVICMVGRLSRAEGYKGHREMIQAWPLVRERVPSAELWIAGDGDLRKDLESDVSILGLEQSVRFLGAVSEEEKENILIRSRALAMPSRGEGFGLVYVEAMRLGRPCLVSDRDAGREVVAPPDCGIAVDPSDQGSLAAAVVRLIEDTDSWKRWSQNARERYERHFTAAHFQQRLLGALRGPS